MTEMKRCCKCKRELPLSAFYKNASRKDGLECRCRECGAVYKRAYREANREKLREQERARCEANREKQAARKHAYYEANREKLMERHRAYYSANRGKWVEYRRARPKVDPEKTAAWNRAWQMSHPEKRAEYKRNRRARKRGNGGSHTAEDIRAQYERQKGRCFWGPERNPGCAVKLDKGYQVDHVIPLALGGSNGPENLVLACPSCNSKKGAKHPTEWAGVLL